MNNPNDIGVASFWAELETNFPDESPDWLRSANLTDCGLSEYLGAPSSTQSVESWFDERYFQNALDSINESGQYVETDIMPLENSMFITSPLEDGQQPLDNTEVSYSPQENMAFSPNASLDGFGYTNSISSSACSPTEQHFGYNAVQTPPVTEYQQLPESHSGGFEFLTNDEAHHIHMNLQSHGIRRKYTCSKCSQTFNGRREHKRHLDVHKKVRQKFFCPVMVGLGPCDENFTRRDNCRRHMKDQHKLTIPEINRILRKTK